MSTLSVGSPFPIFTDRDGAPLEDGYVWLGQPNLDATTNPTSAYWDSELTQLAALPIRTSGGYPVNNGAAGRLYVNNDYSIKVTDKNGSLVYSAPFSTERYGLISSSQVTFKQAGSTVDVTVNEYLKNVAVTPEQFGAIGDGISDDYQALQDALNTGKPVYLHNQYFTSATLSPQGDQIVFGRGKRSLIVASGSYVVIDFSGTVSSRKERLTLRDFTIKRSNNSNIIQLVEFLYANDCLVENVIFDGDVATSSYPGYFAGYSVNRLTVSGCDFLGGASHIIASEGLLSTSEFSNDCTVKNCYMEPSPQQGFNFLYVNNLLVDGCIAHGRASTFGCGFIIEYQGTNIIFSNCIAYDNVRAGFYYEPNIAFGLKSVMFDNCISFNNGETGLFLQNSYGVTVQGGSYSGSTGTFAGSNGGISLADNSQFVMISNAFMYDNEGPGLLLNSGSLNSITGNSFLNNNGPGINFDGVSIAQILTGNIFSGNTSIVNGWVEYQTGTFIDYEWQSFSPDIYANDGITLVPKSNFSFKYKRVGKTCHINGYFEFVPSAANAGIMYIQLPFNVNWSGALLGPDATTARGIAQADVAGLLIVNSLYFQSRLSIPGITAADSTVNFTATFEIQ